jgi:hypothetical protein
MNDIGAALVQTFIALQAIWWLLIIVAAILFFLMPFFILRIRSEVIALKTQAVQLNRNLAALTMITRKVHEERLPPMQCSVCKEPVPWGRRSCKKCGIEMIWD